MAYRIARAGNIDFPISHLDWGIFCHDSRIQTGPVTTNTYAYWENLIGKTIPIKGINDWSYPQEWGGFANRYLDPDAFSGSDFNTFRAMGPCRCLLQENLYNGYDDDSSLWYPSTFTDGDHDEYLIQFAEEVVAWGHDLIMRPWHEGNAGAFISGGTECPSIAGWATGTYYAAGTEIAHAKSGYGWHRYAAKSDHTSGASSEPETGASWATYWTDAGWAMCPWGAKVYEGGTRVSDIADWIAGWRYIVNLFREYDVDRKIKWLHTVLAWPSVAYGGSNATPMADLWPGDDYVDYYGISFYPTNYLPDATTQYPHLDTGLTIPYREMCDVTRTKPLWIVEVGARKVAAHPEYKEAWISRILSPAYLEQYFPRFNTVIAWDSADLWSDSTALTFEETATAKANTIAAFQDAKYKDGD